jgi:adenylyltransferase/sulfurtransferase
MHDRYHRQRILPQVGDAGQARISDARVVLIGSGALGTVLAEAMARAGVGNLIIADRDLVELTNLQRQTLYTEADAAESRPKALAAAHRLAQINSQITIEPRPLDVDGANVEKLIAGATLVLDGTDNAATRYLINDACVKQGLAWIYGAALAMEGRVMPVLPGRGPCLRCIFREMPPAGELDTCDTAGVLGATAGIVASLQSALAIRLLVTGQAPLQLHAIDAWDGRIQAVDVSEARDPDCPCCGTREFEFLGRASADSAALCGQDAVQIRPPRETRVDLAALARRLSGTGQVQALPLMLRIVPGERPALKLTVFSDGRMIVQGTRDVAEARSIYARFVGA